MLPPLRYGAAITPASYFRQLPPCFTYAADTRLFFRLRFTCLPLRFTDARCRHDDAAAVSSPCFADTRVDITPPHITAIVDAMIKIFIAFAIYALRQIHAADTPR